ncbi:MULTISPECIES: hypothetical protein [Nitrosospira]|uniref:hypothetical protein n=1 Tax=Nitrosospira TaxID=35798 RepID=UPI000943566F|nr:MULTISPECIES: hypothetical protein [Nitrosospira]
MIANGNARAFITGPNGVGMTDLGTLDYGYFSEATAINAAGQVVGISGSIFITGPNGAGMAELVASPRIP